MKKRSFKLELFAAILAALVTAITAFDMVGEKARTVNLVTVVAASLTAGIAIGKVAEKYRNEKKSAQDTSSRS